MCKENCYKSIDYARDVVSGNVITPKYVKKTCENFLKIAEGENKKYFLDEDMMLKINGLTKLMNMATGLKAGSTVNECFVGFQWLFVVAILCVKYRNNPDKRLYESATLLISRKNGKTALIAIIFTLSLLLEPEFSEFYSVAADGDLSRQVKKELSQLLKKSPFLLKHFKIKRDEILCKINSCAYKPLNYSKNRLDGRMCKVFLVDEVGALPERYAIEAMRSSQMNMKNRLGILISTAYPSMINPMSEEVEYAKSVLDGYEDDSYFSLLYEPDDKKNWQSNDEIIFQSNPLALEIPENLEYLYKLRRTAIKIPNARTNFKTKNLNIFTEGNEEEKYLEFDKWTACRIDKVDLKGKHVILGADFSLSTDLTAISILYEENGEYFVKSKGFLPEDTLEQRKERIDYRAFEELGYCDIHKGSIVDYEKIEEYIRNIEDNYNCKIDCIATDPFNATELMQRLSRTYKVAFIKQSFTQLSPSIKGFREKVYKGKVFYERNALLDWCIQNTVEHKGKLTEDILLAKENKNKQRIDLVVASIFAFSQFWGNKKASANKHFEDRNFTL